MSEQSSQKRLDLLNIKDYFFCSVLETFYIRALKCAVSFKTRSHHFASSSPFKLFFFRPRSPPPTSSLMSFFVCFFKPNILKAQSIGKNVCFLNSFVKCSQRRSYVTRGNMFRMWTPRKIVLKYGYCFFCILWSYYQDNRCQGYWQCRKDLLQVCLKQIKEKDN